MYKKTNPKEKLQTLGGTELTSKHCEDQLSLSNTEEEITILNTLLPFNSLMSPTHCDATEREYGPFLPAFNW